MSGATVSDRHLPFQSSRSRQSHAPLERYPSPEVHARDKPTVSSSRKETTTLFDCESAFYTTKPPAAIREDAQVKQTHDYIPILYSAWNKLDESDRLTICFGALAVAQVMGTELPRTGQIIFGDIGCTKRVNISDLVRKAKHTVEQITKECESDELPLVVLNKHCQICDFQTRCRGIAVNREDLSLLATMTEKERQKFIEKGITTITQLSYGYRPRRRRRSKLTPSRVSPLVKYDNKLKAIAIKKGQVHVIGAPKFGGDGTLVFIDVEGMPDRDLYYLIGLRELRLPAFEYSAHQPYAWPRSR
jgi:predicted RecB family nuclease